MEKKKENYTFNHDGHRWLHLHPESTEEQYILYKGRDMVAQIRPLDGEKDKSFSLLTKDYATQVWHEKEAFSFYEALDQGSAAGERFIEQVKEKGPPLRYPPYLHKQQIDDHIWTTDSRNHKGAELLQYIEDDEGLKVVEIAHIDEGGGHVAFYVSLMHSQRKEGEAPFRTHELEQAYEYGGEKADEYLLIDKAGFEWIYQGNEHPMFYTLENENGNVLAIISPNDESRTVDGHCNARLEVKDAGTNDWVTTYWNENLDTAFEWGKSYAAKYLRSQQDKEVTSAEFPGQPVIGICDDELAIESKEVPEIDVEME